MKKILLFTAKYTGHGHKSISDSLCEQFAAIDGIEVKVVDGFDLFGKIGSKLSKTYGPMTRYAKGFWDVAWHFSDHHDSVLSKPVTDLGMHNFNLLIRDYQPDLILTVHSMFNGSVLRMLKKGGYSIPLVVLQADLINIHKTWCEPGAYKTICPTPEAYACSLKHGMPEDKLVLIGFPTRRRFTDAAREIPDRTYDASRPLRCLLMSGGEGSGNMKRLAETMLKKTDVSLTIICGRNKKIRRQLMMLYGRTYGDRLKVMGFVTDMESVMAENDVLITRASPNALYEGIVMNLPILVTGALPGQEYDNPLLIKNHKLGLSCDSPAKLLPLIESLKANDGALFNSIAAAQREYRDLDNAWKIARYVADLANETK